MGLRRMNRRYQVCLKILIRCPNGRDLEGGTMYHPGLSKDEAMRHARNIMLRLPNRPDPESPVSEEVRNG